MAGQARQAKSKRENRYVIKVMYEYEVKQGRGCDSLGLGSRELKDA
jgi:hypothetical protein